METAENEERRCGGYDELALGEPGGGGSDGIREAGHCGESDFRHQDHGVDPKVPGDEESGEIPEGATGPLIQASLQWAPAVQMDYDHSLRNVKEHNGGQPENDVGSSQLGGVTEIGESDDEQNLGEDEVSKAEFPLESRRTVRMHRSL